MPNWKDPVTNERLLAALVASLVAQNAKVNSPASKPQKHIISNKLRSTTKVSPP